MWTRFLHWLGRISERQEHRYVVVDATGKPCSGARHKTLDDAARECQYWMDEDYDLPDDQPKRPCEVVIEWPRS